jgi:hypothetical protein
VLLPPETVSGVKALNATLSRQSRCLSVVAVAAEGGTLALKLRTPSGEVVAGPTPSAVVEHRYCATGDGEHRVEITPAGAEPYSVAAVECPRPIGTKTVATKPVATSKVARPKVRTDFGY